MLVFSMAAYLGATLVLCLCIHGKEFLNHFNLQMVIQRHVVLLRAAGRGEAAAGGTEARVPRRSHLGHGEGGQVPGLTMGNVALQLLIPRLVGGQDGLTID